MLRVHGFTRSSGTFRRMSEFGAQMIQFQGSTGSWGDTSLFYVNLGVATGPWLAWFEERLGIASRTRPEPSVGRWWARLPSRKPFRDSFERWAIRSVEPASECGAVIGSRLTEAVLPYMDQALAYLVQEDYVVATDGDVKRFRAKNQPRPAVRLAGGHFDRYADDGRYDGWLRSHRHLLPASTANLDVGGPYALG